MRNNLIKKRKKAKLTQVELAEKIKVTERHYKSLEAGTSKGSVQVWEKLRDLLKAPNIDYLLQEETKKA